MSDESNRLDDIQLNVAPGGDLNKRVKTGGKTSIEAAVEYLDAMEEQKHLFDMDALERSALRNAMGFDFELKFAPNKIFVNAIGHKKLRVHIKLEPTDSDDEGNLIPDRLYKRLADACIQLKVKYDAKMGAAA